MSEERIIKGHLKGPTSVELERPVSDVEEEVEVVVRPRTDSKGLPKMSVGDFLRSLPPGTRSKADIDSQIDEERNSWGD